MKEILVYDYDANLIAKIDVNENVSSIIGYQRSVIVFSNILNEIVFY
jgi:hypothetical protein